MDFRKKNDDGILESIFGTFNEGKPDGIPLG